MVRTITVRLDDEAGRALETLERTGLSKSEAIRTALVAAHRAALRAEAERIAADPDDRREVAEVQALLDEISEPW